MPGETVAGNVNIVTRSAFDYRGFHVAGKAGYGHAELGDRPEYEASAVVSNRFTAGDGEIGLLLSGSFHERNMITDNFHCQPDEPTLWISESGSRFTSGFRVRERIERCTEVRFGKRINPHLFRDIAATSIATEIPADAGIIGLVLGPANLKTGERSYNQARSAAASAAYQRALDQCREPAPPLLPVQYGATA